MTLARLAAALVLLAVSACHRAGSPRPVDAAPPPTPAESPAAASFFSPPREAQELTTQQIEARDAMFEKYGPPTTSAAAARQALALEREYQSETEYLPRVEIIHRLADASSLQSRETLSRLFLTEKDLELRVQMVRALPFADAADLNPSLPILREALKPGQPRELREAGLDAIQSLNDARTLPLLQLLLNDPDEELRETATKTSEYYLEVLELERR